MDNREGREGKRARAHGPASGLPKGLGGLLETAERATPGGGLRRSRGESLVPEGRLGLGNLSHLNLKMTRRKHFIYAGNKWATKRSPPKRIVLTFKLNIAERYCGVERLFRNL